MTAAVAQPWLGLLAYEEKHAPLFFGRAREAADLFALVQRDRLTVLYGMSGLGKSSLLQAGLFPRLEGSAYLPISVRIDHESDQRGDAPPQPIAAQLLAEVDRRVQVFLGQDTGEVAVATTQSTLWEFFHHRDHVFWSTRNRIITPVLVLDQFEEIFTRGRATAERTVRTDAFLDELSALIENRPPPLVRAAVERGEEVPYDFDSVPLRLVVSLREDFLPELAMLRGRFPGIRRNEMRLLPFALEQAREVIERPAPELLAPGFSDALLAFLVSSGGIGRLAGEHTRARAIDGVEQTSQEGSNDSLLIEPALLSVLLAELDLERRTSGAVQLTADQLQRDKDRILTDFYRRAFEGTGHQVQVFVENELLTASGFRDSRAVEDALMRPGVTQAALDALVGRRLLRYEERTGGVRRIEFTHDLLCSVALAARLAREVEERREREEAESRVARQREEAERARLTAEAARERDNAEQLRSALAKAERARSSARFFAAVASLIGLAAIVLAWLAWDYAARVIAERARAQHASAGSALREARRMLSSGARVTALTQVGFSLKLEPHDVPAESMLTDLIQRGPFGLVLRHEEAVGAVSFSPDGRRVATASADKTSRIWDAATAAPVGDPLWHDDMVFGVAFSPDGTRVATSSLDKSARIWDATTGAPVGIPLRHEYAVASVVFSPDGTRVATASEDKTARIWDTATGAPTGMPLRHDAAVRAVVFSADGTRVATASRDHTARVWDVATGDPVGALLQHKGKVYAVAFSPDGTRVATASEDETAQIWDAGTGAPVGGPLQHEDEVLAVAFSPDGTWVVTGSADSRARVWEAETGELLKDARTGVPLEVWHDGPVVALAFSPDGTRVATASEDKTARVWEAATGRWVGGRLEHGSPVVAVAFSPDGTQVATASWDGTARVWRTGTVEPAAMSLVHRLGVRAVVFSPDGTRVATASNDKTARIWDAGTAALIGTPLQHGSAVRAVAFSRNGTRVATASDDKTARIWDAATGASVGTPLRHNAKVRAVAFSPDGSRIATASDDKTAQIWDAATGAPVGAPLRHRSKVYAVAFSPDGTRVATASLGKTARIWDVATGTPAVAPLRHKGPVYSVAFSPDGMRVATASGDGRVRTWDVTTGALVGAPLRHESDVLDVTFSPDGMRLATASLGRTARIWDATSGNPVGLPLVHQAPVTAVDFSPDGTRVATASADGTARIWDATTGAPLGGSLWHMAGVMAVEFSSDGARVATASADGTARIWDVGVRKSEDAGPLSDLAEVLSGYRLSETGAFESLSDIASRREALRARAGTSSLVAWSLADPLERTISPYSAVKVQEYVERCLTEGRIAELQNTFGGHPLLWSTAPCRQSPDPGSCRAAIPNYYFDAESHECREFKWGGCGGAVPFSTADACRSACAILMKKLSAPAP